MPLKIQSLTSSGLCILFAPRQVYIWVGSEFSSRYIARDQLEQKRTFISEGLFLRLLTIYKREILTSPEGTDDEISTRALSRAKVLTEGEETTKFLKLVNGEALDNQSGGSS